MGSVNQKTVEHIIPKSKGGNDSSYNRITVCHSCNCWRGNIPLNEFLSNVLDAKNFKSLSKARLRKYCHMENQILILINYTNQYKDRMMHNDRDDERSVATGDAQRTESW